MAPKAITLNYRSVERFSKDYDLLKKGKIFLPSKTLLPLKTALTLNFTVPEIDNVFTVHGVVVKTIEEPIAAQIQKPPGMLLAVVDELDSILSELRSVLSAHKDYQKLLGLKPPAKSAPPPVNQEAEIEDGGEAKLSLEWLRKAVAQEKVE